MTTPRCSAAVLALGLAVLCSGCASVPPSPRKERVEITGPAPHPGMHWRKGRWVYRGENWIWVPGQWVDRR
jgi:hypothetical protein